MTQPLPSPRPRPLRAVARLTLLAAAAAAQIAFLPPPAPAEARLEGSLPRRVHVGVALAPAPGGEGVLLQVVSPSGPAHAAGLRAGDLLTAIDGAPVATPAAAIDAIRTARPGDPTVWTGRRDAAPASWEFTYGLLPMEDAPDFTVIYGTVTSAGGDPLRSILTLPPGDGPHPVLYYVQGITCASIDWPGQQGPPPRTFLHDLTRAGWATWRVEKRGLGDSRGAPCSTLDFDAEGADYLASLRALKADARIDADRVVLFGHSMGGVFALWLSREVPVAGVVVYGTSAAPWLEYMIANTRRQTMLGGATYAAASDELQRQFPFYTALFVDRLAPDDIRAARPAAVGPMEEAFDSPTTMFSRHYTFYHQLAVAPVATWWTEADAPVLVVRGAADFVTARAEHEAIVELVNGVRPGSATFLEVPAADHIFAAFDSEAASMAGGMQGSYQPAVGTSVLAWLTETVGGAAGAGAAGTTGG